MCGILGKILHRRGCISQEESDHQASFERFTTDYDLPNDSNYSETCASIGMALFSLRMANITRNSRYAELMEQELYNNILAGIAQTARAFST